MIDERFHERGYVDIAGMCGVATVGEIEKQGWSLNPGRYVGTAYELIDEGSLVSEIAELTQEFTMLASQSASLSTMVATTLENVSKESS